MYRLIAGILFIQLLCGCAAAVPHPRSSAGAQSAARYQAPVAAQPMEVSASRSLVQTCRVPALVELWQHRESAPSQDLPIGPGDIIDISVPEIEELQNQRTRVSAQGDMELPLIGTVNASGLSESELHDALVRKVRVYMKDPRVELFVENYRSRGVAIIGAV